MSNRFLWAGAAVLAAMSPNLALACACGCGVFDVQTGSMLPNGPGGTVWAEYDFMNQNINWSGTSVAPAANNTDKVIRTHFMTAGGQYMFSREWGVNAEVPYWDRYFKTTDDSGNLVGFNHDNFGDVRVRGVYSGFSPDMSTGITFGFKLPTGDYKYANFDRDTEIGTGSTDLLLGAYHMGRLTKDNSWSWFTNVNLDQPFIISSGYRPGSEWDAVTGVYYDKWSWGGVKIAPIAQVIGSWRLSDRGPASNPDDSGYKRILLSPGVEVSRDNWRLYADVAFPVYQQMIGNQLTAPALFKISLSHDF
jgi:hypothetical protein